MSFSLENQLRDWSVFTVMPVEIILQTLVYRRSSTKCLGGRGKAGSPGKLGINMALEAVTTSCSERSEAFRQKRQSDQIFLAFTMPAAKTLSRFQTVMLMHLKLFNLMNGSTKRELMVAISRISKMLPHCGIPFVPLVFQSTLHLHTITC